jgi:DNA invertase Pin-like site-specific DNA recombinase
MIVLYARVSTAHQVTQAQAMGFKMDKVVAGEGVSGNGKCLFDILRPGDVLVVRWVERLGRNYMDVCDDRVVRLRSRHRHPLNDVQRSRLAVICGANTS